MNQCILPNSLMCIDLSQISNISTWQYTRDLTQPKGLRIFKLEKGYFDGPELSRSKLTEDFEKLSKAWTEYKRHIASRASGLHSL